MAKGEDVRNALANRVAEKKNAISVLFAEVEYVEPNA
jgi:hypothetical protein